MKTSHYKIFDSLIESDLSLPELATSEDKGDAIQVFKGKSGSQPKSPRWYHEWHTGFPRAAYIDGGYWLSFRSVLEVSITDEGKCIRYFPAPGAPPESVRHVLLDCLLPLLLGDQGRLILHASAVVLPSGKTVAFLGASGMGKSTLAGYLYGQGAVLLTDDCLMLYRRGEEICCVPNYFGLRLNDDSNQHLFDGAFEENAVSHYSAKRRLLVPQNATLPAQADYALDALFVMDDVPTCGTTPAVAIKPSRSALGFATLLKHIFSLDPNNRDIASKRFTAVGDLYRAETPVYNLKYQRSYDLLSEVYEAIDATLDDTITAQPF